jgi:hypothetical protein
LLFALFSLAFFALRFAQALVAHDLKDVFKALSCWLGEAGQNQRVIDEIAQYAQLFNQILALLHQLSKLLVFADGESAVCTTHSLHLALALSDGKSGFEMFDGTC